ncbi:hypothetical protein N7494_005418 [Penicillium frequentans]|uniref:Uncharacterized protein n=1 Tax=Penicillium frequentans TaxID=3151616 RepID=A0AAD6D089_9EURO|nr:hypothetical protein N7494_005418 [Penicillium glabrum]
MIDDESSTKPEPGSTKTNPIVIDDESGSTIKFGVLLEELTYDTAWPAPSGQDADIPKALALSLDECYFQEAERNYHQGTRTNERSSPLGSAANPMIHIDKDCSTNQRDSEAGTQVTPDYLSLPYWAFDSPPVTF